MKIQHILFTTDMSDASFRPVEAVHAMARQHGARVTLFHVVHVVPMMPYGAAFAPPVTPGNTSEYVELAREHLDKRREELLWDDIETDVAVVADGDVGGAVHRYAEEHGVDLVALSTHGHTGLRRLVLGSVAELIIRHSDVPVLAFPLRDSKE